MSLPSWREPSGRGCPSGSGQGGGLSLFVTLSVRSPPGEHLNYSRLHINQHHVVHRASRLSRGFPIKADRFPLSALEHLNRVTLVAKIQPFHSGTSWQIKSLAP